MVNSIPENEFAFAWSAGESAHVLQNEEEHGHVVDAVYGRPGIVQ